MTKLRNDDARRDLVRRLAAADGEPRELNREGLTWPEWWRATGINPDGMRGGRAHQLLAAWRAGEDPTEYAASVRCAR